MGWASGSYLAEKMWDKLKKLIPAEQHVKAARIIVKAFENHDADDWNTDKGGLYYLAATKKEQAEMDRDDELDEMAEDEPLWMQYDDEDEP